MTIERKKKSKSTMKTRRSESHTSPSKSPKSHTSPSESPSHKSHTSLSESHAKKSHRVHVFGKMRRINVKDGVETIRVSKRTLDKYLYGGGNPDESNVKRWTLDVSSLSVNKPASSIHTPKYNTNIKVSTQGFFTPAELDGGLVILTDNTPSFANLQDKKLNYNLILKRDRVGSKYTDTIVVQITTPYIYVDDKKTMTRESEFIYVAYIIKNFKIWVKYQIDDEVKELPKIDIVGKDGNFIDLPANDAEKISFCKKIVELYWAASINNVSISRDEFKKDKWYGRKHSYDVTKEQSLGVLGGITNMFKRKYLVSDVDNDTKTPEKSGKKPLPPKHFQLNTNEHEKVTPQPIEPAATKIHPGPYTYNDPYASRAY